MFLAIDRVSRFTCVGFHDGAGKMEGSAFLRIVVEAFPYEIHIALTDNGMAFTDLSKNRDRPGARLFGPNIFSRACVDNGIEHRLIDGGRFSANNNATRTRSQFRRRRLWRPRSNRALSRAQARRYGDLAVKARAAGKGFPTPDGHIAAKAAAHGLAVASRDSSAFTAAGLTVINPWTVAG